MLSGIIVGIAQAMGMHRDSTSFSLDVVEIEVRRRIWWTLCVLDNRISEDCGLESHVPMTMDTRLPLHVNDSDLNGHDNTTPNSKTEFTEMTVSLIKMELAEAALKIKLSQYAKSELSEEDIEALIAAKVSRYETTYLKYLDQSSHLQRLCYLGTRLIIAKLWRMTYDPYHRSTAPISEEIKAMLLLYNTEVLELAHQLPGPCSKYGWAFWCKHTQWHATAFLLIELCHYTEGPIVDRAWAALNAVFASKIDDDNRERSPNSLDVSMKKSVLWLPLQRLFERARQVREQAVYQALPLTPNSNVAHSINPGYENGYGPDLALPIDDSVESSKHGKVLLGDPFLGSGPELVGEEMDWENWDMLVQSFQSEVLQQSQQQHEQQQQAGMVMEYEMINSTVPSGWW